MTSCSLVRPPRVALMAMLVALFACGAPDTSEPIEVAPRATPEEPPAPGAAAPSSSAQSPAGAWAHAYLGDVQIDGLGSDASGAVFAAGYFVGSAKFDAKTTFESARDASGQSTKDIFVAKHGRDGALAWVRHFAGAGLEGNVYDLVASGDGTVYASGAFSGTVDFDGEVLTSTASAGTGSDSSGTYGNMFLAALDASGKVKWVEQGLGNVVSGGNEVALDPSGAVLQIGMYGGKAAGGKLQVAGRELAFGGGGYDTYVAKVSRNGGVAWIQPIGGDGAQRGKAIASDKDGNVLIAGDAWGGTTELGPGASFTTTAATSHDFWVAKYSPEGALLWFRSFGSAGMDEVKGVSADPSGNVVVAATVEGPTMSLGDRVVSITGAGARRTGVVFALSPDGKRTVWTNTISYVNKCCEMEMDARGHVFVSTAGIAPEVTFQTGSPFALGGAPRGGLLAELDGQGAHVGSRTVQAEAAEFGELSILGGGYVAVAGSFEGGTLRHAGTEIAAGPGRTQVVLVLAP